MNGKCLLDTNIIISLFKNEKEIVEKIKSFARVFISVTVIGELFYGAFKSQQIEKNLENIAALLSGSDILKIDNNIAREYGEIKAILKKKGKPIPENDIWVAAAAKRHDLTLISKDAHFNEVDELDFSLIA